MNIYETQTLLHQYLLFHYGSAEEISPPPGAKFALEYPQRCVRECLHLDDLPEVARGLDLGCAVGASSFELARHCKDVVGIDLSENFIDVANALKEEGTLEYDRPDEGELSTRLTARVPREIEREGVTFQVGDALKLPLDLGKFDVVMMINLIDRVADPAKCVSQSKNLLHKNGQLLICSPYTWLEEFTPKQNWLGGLQTKPNTIDSLRDLLWEDFELLELKDMPFLIREHPRKFQLSSAQSSLWRKKP